MPRKPSLRSTKVTLDRRKTTSRSNIKKAQLSRVGRRGGRQNRQR